MSKPAVVFGGPSPEHDISILTGLQAARTLVDAGVDVACHLLGEDGALVRGRSPPRGRRLSPKAFLNAPRNCGS